MNAQVTNRKISDYERQSAAQDAMNGIKELLWNRIYSELGHEPSLAEANQVIASMSDADLFIYL